MTAQRAWVATRKGLFERARRDGRWSIEHLSFPGDPVSAVLAPDPQVAGRPISILFCFEGEHPWKFMPSYQEIANLSFAERYARLRDPAFRARLLSEQDPNDQGFSLLYKNPALWDFTYPAGNPINYTPDPNNSVAKIAAREGRSPWEVAYDLLLADNGQIGRASCRERV